MNGSSPVGLPTLVIGNRNYSSWSLRAWFFLSHHKIDFETMRLPLDTPGFAAQIIDYSPTRRVPVLLHDGQTVWDSLAICEYAAENLTVLPAWPESRDARAFARSISCEIHSGFDDLRRELPLNCRAMGRCVSPGTGASHDIERVISIWNEGRKRFGQQGPWLCGRFSIADAMYAPVALRFRTYGVDLPRTASDWVEEVATHPSIREWIQASANEDEVIESEEIGRQPI
jgi:glutathione S-transferase